MNLTFFHYYDNVGLMSRKPKDAPRLGEFELILVLALVRVGEQGYGAALAREIEEQTDRAVSLGAVYKTLERLEKKRWLSSWTGEPLPERGGRRRKHYRVEPAGREALERSLADIGNLTRGLDLPIDQPIDLPGDTA